MNRFLKLLATSSLALTTLIGCEQERLSVGELRCQGVSCAPHHNDLVDEMEVVNDEDEGLAGLSDAAVPGEPEHVRLGDVVGAKRAEVPCPFDGNCRRIASRLTRLERDGETSALVVSVVQAWNDEAPDEPIDQHGLWFGRYADGEWLSEIARGDGLIDTSGSYTLAVATSEVEPADAVVVVSELFGGPTNEHKLQAYAYGTDDEVELLFEHDEEVRVDDAALIGDDILVVDSFHSLLELTRYTRDGDIVFRQSALASADGEISLLGVDVLGQAQLEVIDDDTIVVLIPRDQTYEIAVLDGSGVVRWSTTVGLPHVSSNTYSAQLTVDDEGGILVGVDGYSFERFERDGDILRSRGAGRSRSEFYDLNVYGFDTADSGFSYFGTQDGDRDDRRIILERISPSLETVQSARIEVDAECGSPFGFGSGTELIVEPDERVAFTLNDDCFLELPLSVFE